MFQLLGCMLLMMLDHVEPGDLLSPTGPVTNFGLVMGLYTQFFERAHSDYGLLEEDMDDKEVIGGFLMLNDTILSYARKHNVEIRGADVLKHIIDGPDEIDGLEIPGVDDP